MVEPTGDSDESDRWGLENLLDERGNHAGSEFSAAVRDAVADAGASDAGDDARIATIQIEGRTLSGATVAITMSPRHGGGGNSAQVTPLGE